MTIEILLSRLEGVVGRGPSYRARCPSHQREGRKNRAPTLSLREETDGRVLVRCFAGCSVEEILGAVGLEFDVLFPPRVGDDKRNPPVKKPWRPAEVCQALEFELTEHFLLCAMIGRGAPVTAKMRKELDEGAKVCAALCTEIAGRG